MESVSFRDGSLQGFDEKLNRRLGKAQAKAFQLSPLSHFSAEKLEEEILRNNGLFRTNDFTSRYMRGISCGNPRRKRRF
jgi:hypothetical protein